jgi:hypothetical protein
MGELIALGPAQRREHITKSHIPRARQERYTCSEHQQADAADCARYLRNRSIVLML